MMHPCCGGKRCEFNKLASDIHAAGGLDAWGKARPKMVFVKAMESPADIHAAAVQRLASISARATELARAGGMTSHEAAMLDSAIYAHGERLASLAPKRR